MERLIAAGADVNGGNGAALVWAARSGAADSIPVLVKHGANPNLTNGVNSWTPLMHAIHKHQVAAVGALLKAGAAGAGPQRLTRVHSRTPGKVMALEGPKSSPASPRGVPRLRRAV